MTSVTLTQQQDSLCSLDDFDTIKISLRTEIVISNLIIDLQKLHETAPIFELDIPRHLKNKKNIIKYILDYPTTIRYGSIITSELRDNVRGFKIKKRKQWDECAKKTHFRNSIAFTLYMDKLINIKIPMKGKIQITGCTKESHVFECMKQIWIYLNYPDKIYTFDPDIGYDYLYMVSRTVMTNKDFKLGFKVDRENLDWYINKHTRFHSLLETSVGYTGVNIKAPHDHANSDINTFSYKETILSNNLPDEKYWIQDTINYNQYLQLLSPKDRKKEISKRRNVTFLTFYSGTCIISGINTQYMKGPFYEFMNIIKAGRSLIEEDTSRFEQ